MNTPKLFDSFLGLFPVKSFSLEKKELEDLISHLKHIEDYTNPGMSLIYILNYETMRYEYLNSAFEKVLVDDLEATKKKGVQFFFEQCHPEDIQIITQKVLPFLLNVFQGLSLEEKYQSRIQYNYRLKNKKGVYFNCLQQFSCVQLDQHGNPLVDFGFLSNLGTPEKSNPIKCRLSIIRNGIYEPLYENEYDVGSNEKSNSQLTNRQLEITKQLVEGKNGKEIADQLFISLNTLNTHKRNIYKRLKINSATELVSIAIRNKWV